MSQRPPRLLTFLVAGVMTCAAALPATPVWATTPAASTSAKAQAGKVYSQQDLDELLAPIALHPDPLLAQILMGSTYPLDIVEAQRWRKANPELKGDSLEKALVSKTWDPSVKSLAAVPTVLDMMSESLGWTQKLGDAFLGQQRAVMDTVQHLRAKAMEAGTLASTQEQTVSSSTEGSTTIIKIEPADPQVVYVPTYNPAVVYGAWWYPYPPPYYYYPVGYVPGAAFFSFTAGVIIGGAFWGNCNWGGGDINIDIDRYNRVTHHDRNSANNVRNGKWQHNPEQRRGVPYRGEGAQSRFGSTQVRDNEARQAFRDNGRQTLQAGSDRAASRAAAADRGMDRDARGRSDRGSRSASAGSHDHGGFERTADVRPQTSTLDRGGLSDSGLSGRDGTNAFSDRGGSSRTTDFSVRGSSGRSGFGGGMRGGGGRR